MVSGPMGDDITLQGLHNWLGRLDARVVRIEEADRHAEVATSELKASIRGLSSRLDRFTFWVVGLLGAALMGLVLELVKIVIEARPGP